MAHRSGSRRTLCRVFVPPCSDQWTRITKLIAHRERASERRVSQSVRGTAACVTTGIEDGESRCLTARLRSRWSFFIHGSAGSSIDWLINSGFCRDFDHHGLRHWRYSPEQTLRTPHRAACSHRCLQNARWVGIYTLYSLLSLSGLVLRTVWMDKLDLPRWTRARCGTLTGYWLTTAGFKLDFRQCLVVQMWMCCCLIRETLSLSLTHTHTHTHTHILLRFCHRFSVP